MNNDVSESYGNFRQGENSWLDIVKGHLNCAEFGGFINSKSFKKELNNIEFRSDSFLDKISTIYKYIGKNYTLEKGQTLAFGRKADQLILKKRGKSSDLNLMLVGLLQLKGLKAFPVIITPNPHPEIDTLIPSIPEFPKAICLVKTPAEENYFLDISHYPGPPDLLPLEDINGFGLILRDTGSYEWGLIKPYDNSVKWNKVSFNFSNDNLEALLEMDHKGYHAKYQAESLLRDKTRYLKDEFSRFDTTTNQLNLNVNLLPSTDNCKYKSSIIINIKNYIDINKDSITLDPMLGFGLTENPFTNNIRYYPVDFTNTFDEIYQLSLEIPNGYKLSKLPENEKIKNADNTLKFLYAWDNTDNKLNLIYKFNVKKPLFDLDEFKELRDFYTLVFQKCTEKLVFIKSSE